MKRKWIGFVGYTDGWRTRWVSGSRKAAWRRDRRETWPQREISTVWQVSRCSVCLLMVSAGGKPRISMTKKKLGVSMEDIKFTWQDAFTFIIRIRGVRIQFKNSLDNFTVFISLWLFIYLCTIDKSIHHWKHISSLFAVLLLFLQNVVL